MTDAVSVDQPTSIRVLVCDDQVLVRTGLVTIFSAQPDLEVVGEAADGIAAVREARRLEPDVVVMDVRMPGLDGIEATRRLAGPEVTEPRIKVLVVTTFNLDDYVYEALRAGASGFLLKDSGPMQLVEAVRTVAAGESLLAPAVTRALVGRFASRVAPPTPSAPARSAAGATGSTGEGLLSPRENEVLKLLAAGMSNAEIAQALFITHETVKTYVSRILAKLDLRDRVHAVIYAYRNGIVNAEA